MLACAPVVAARSSEVRDPTQWTISQQDGPNHLWLWLNAIPAHKMALTTSDCVPLERCLPEPGEPERPDRQLHHDAHGPALRQQPVRWRHRVRW